MKDKKFVLFLHSGNYDKLYQAVMLAITSASMGNKVYIFLFFWALRKFVTDKIDVIEFPDGMHEEDKRLLEAVPQGQPNMLKELLSEVSKMGNLEIYACSGAVKLMELDEELVKSKVKEIIGLPTMLKMAEGAETQLFI
ncbi:MAG: DsrE/DsrF/DrsH-like family protein [Candidatus Scalindua sp.]